MLGFRVWDNEKKVFIVGGIHMAQFYSNETPMLLMGGHPLSSNRYIPMQSTGLKDFKGMEIFEGDVVLSESETDSFRMIVKNVTEFLTIFYPDFEGVRPLWNVLGNIYENPELLERTRPCAKA